MKTPNFKTEREVRINESTEFCGTIAMSPAAVENIFKTLPLEEVTKVKINRETYYFIQDVATIFQIYKWNPPF